MHNDNDSNIVGWIILGIGVGLGSPALIALGAIQIATAPAAAGATVGAATVSGTAAAGTGAAVFSAATLGIGAAVIYAGIGLMYLYSSTKEAYNSDTSIFEMLKSRIVRDEKLSFTSVLKTIGSVLWSPFILLGGLTGKMVKAITSSFASRSENKSNADAQADDGLSSKKGIVASLENSNDLDNDPSLLSPKSLWKKEEVGAQITSGVTNNPSL